MVSQAIFILLSITGCVLLIISECLTALAGGKIDIEYVADARTKRYVCQPYGLNSLIFQNGGYCKDILGNLPVYGRDIDELYYNEKKLRRYELTMYLFQQMEKIFLQHIRQNLTEEQKKIRDKSFWLRQSCLEQVDDIYCHHYFKRCYLSSSPQPVCREVCVELTTQSCDREFDMVSAFNRKRLETPDWPFDWDIINCTTLPFRNESSNCYYPDKIRDNLNVLESEDCFYGDGRGYRGNISYTVSGYRCQPWNAQYPHQHRVLSGDLYKEIKNASNFCRNPGGLGLNGTWCFTTNKTMRWEYCDVPKCAKQPPARPPTDFRGHNVSSTSIKVFWEDVPRPFVNGIIMGFHVTCRRSNSSGSRHLVDLTSAGHDWEFRGLDKYMNYSFWLRAYNNFGNGTWSDELLISTDEDAPSAPPESLKAWNLSSTSLLVQWSPIPTKKRHGKILGYNVEIRPEKQSQGQMKLRSNYTTSRSVTFRALKKYSKYVISVYGLTRRGKGPSQIMTVQTDEDVPDQPPQDITALSLGKNTVQLEWSPVSPEYTNGQVVGYEVLYSDVKNTSRSNNITAPPGETRLKITGLKPNTNYSFQMLAFTTKGDGPRSANYFAKTEQDENPSTKYMYKAGSTNAAGIITAAVFSCVVAIGGVFLLIYFVRKRGKLRNTSCGNTLRCLVEPYAVSSPRWIENIISHGYETLDDENVPTASLRPLYVNITPDGSLDLPPSLRNIFLEFEQSYENTNYKRLQRRRRRRSVGGAVDIHGNPIYDKLRGVVSPPAPCESTSCSQEAKKMTTTEYREDQSQHLSTILGEPQGFVLASENDVCSAQMMEMQVEEPTRRRRRRRFSVDLGEIREFIALRDMNVSAT